MSEHITGKIITGRRPRQADEDAIRRSERVASNPVNVITFEFPPGAVIDQGFIVTNHQYVVEYRQARTKGDIEGYEFILNGSSVNLPFSVKDGDELIVSITKQDFANTASIEIST